jgi:starch synthase
MPASDPKPVPESEPEPVAAVEPAPEPKAVELEPAPAPEPEPEAAAPEPESEPKPAPEPEPEPDPKPPLRVTFATTEAVPFVKTGGLGDVAGSLPIALAKAGVKVSVILPKYSFIPGEWLGKMEHVCEFYVPLAWRNEYCGIEHLEREGVDFYFVDNERYFKRDAAYGYFDDGERFAFFSKAVLEAMEHVDGLVCDVLHCNDWQTALAPVFLREFYRGDARFDNVRTVFTVHNVRFQGQYSDELLGDLLGLSGVPAAASQLRMDSSSIDFMKGALCYSDALTTVSPSYAEELKMPYYGEGLDSIFRDRASVLSGVLNGIDTKEWDPSADPLIPAHYDAGDMAGKHECKRALQEELGIDVDDGTAIIGFVGRLTSQKGLDLIQYGLDQLIGGGYEFVVLGTGDRNYEDSMRYFDYAYHGRMRACITFDNALAHRIYAGADLLLMPSQFEPCGLSQMIAMRYGTLPVVRETGGLRDSVVPYNRFTGEGTGFSFANFNADEMVDALWRAGEVYEGHHDVWERLQRQAMEQDFSWDRSAQRYLEIYRGLHPELA